MSEVHKKWSPLFTEVRLVAPSGAGPVAPFFPTCLSPRSSLTNFKLISFSSNLYVYRCPQLLIILISLAEIQFGQRFQQVVLHQLLTAAKKQNKTKLQPYFPPFQKLT